MKKALKVMIVLFLSLTACGKKEEEIQEVEEEPVVVATPEPEYETIENLITENETEEDTQEEEEPAAEETRETAEEERPLDLDITFMSSTAIYSAVYNMIMNPEEYVGKYIKIKGFFAVGESYTGEEMYGCVIPDATQCCVQGIQFLWKGDHVYPDDYPEIGTNIIVQGIFAYDRVDEYTVAVRLEDADMFIE